MVWSIVGRASSEAGFDFGVSEADDSLLRLATIASDAGLPLCQLSWKGWGVINVWYPDKIENYGRG